MNVQLQDPGPVHQGQVRQIERDALAHQLRYVNPGQWGIISEGHSSLQSAGQVRRTLLKREPWVGFEMVSRKQEDQSATIFARWPVANDND